MMDAILGRPETILAIPLCAAAVLAVLPGYRVTAAINVAGTFLTLLAAITLFLRAPLVTSDLFLVDELNIVFVLDRKSVV